MAAGEFALGLLNILHSNIIRRELRIPITILRKAKALPGGVGNSFFPKSLLESRRLNLNLNFCSQTKRPQM